MRLLLVTQDFPPDVGGIQTYSWELSRRLAARAEALHVVAPARPGAASVDASVPFPVQRVLGRPDLLPLTALATVPPLARRARPDVAFHAQWQTVGASVLARALTGWPRRIACAAHGRELLFNPLPKTLRLDAAYDRLRRRMLGWVDTFVPVSHYTAGLLEDRGVPAERLHVVPNGTDPERFRPVDATPLRRHLDLGDRPLLLTVGRLVPRKGIDTILRALPSISEAAPEVQYLIVGTGPDRDRLEQIARTVGVTDRVHVLGQVPHGDLPHYYSAADVFVMPSRETPPDVEGFGLVFLEANACGTPVIGARSGGIPDAVVDGETGLLVPPSSPEALAQAALSLLTDADRRAALGNHGRRRAATTLNWDRIGARIYRHLAATSGTTAPDAE